MRLKTLLAVCAVLCLAMTSLAQDRPDAKDPVTGQWGSDGQPLLDLKYDGKGTITGTTIWRQGGREIARSPIKSGTFNAKSGAFRLEGDTQHPSEGTSVRYVIEGTIEKDTATGTYQLGAEKGDFTFRRLS